MFKPGDILECVANNVINPYWKGILPEIGCYYTWRSTWSVEARHGYVEEIISPLNQSGIEYLHDSMWYRKINDNVNIQALMEETQLQEA